jgi:hypothetical protein
LVSTAAYEQALPNGDHRQADEEPLQKLSDAIGSVLQQSTIPTAAESDASSQMAAASDTLELERRNRELAEQLQQHVEGIKQWENYCQNMVSRSDSLAVASI